MRKLLSVLSLIIALNVYGQSNAFRVASWNLENLFDTAHDEGKEDYEFLPTAKRQWNTPRYWHKLRGVTQTLAAMELPSIIGVQEVENDTVLRDLTRRTALWNAHYKYVMTDSPDARGVDVALLYKPSDFQLINWHSVRVPSQQNGLRPTRDILYVSGKIIKSIESAPLAPNVLHICVVHLPSRQNNNAATVKNRQLAVQTLIGIIDSINNLGMQSLEPSGTDEAQGTTIEPHILIMGDFNAEPGDDIFKQLMPPLNTLLPTKRKELRKAVGTYYFKGVWGYLDHMLVSDDMLKHVKGQARECRFPWLLRTEKQIPRRTYGGTSYIGGISDHLPLIADFEF